MPLAHAHTVADGAPGQLPAGAGLLLEWTFDPTFLLPLAVFQNTSIHFSVIKTQLISDWLI